MELGWHICQTRSRSPVRRLNSSTSHGNRSAPHHPDEGTLGQRSASDDRGRIHRNLPRARFCNPFKVSEFGRELAVNLFEQYLDSSQELTRELKSLSGKRLLCHCPKGQRCHADALILKFSNMYPEAYSRTNPVRPPTSSELNLLAKHREEPQSEEGSSADEGVPPKGSGWCGTGEPMSVGIGYTSREYCDGQGLASPGRWPVASRRYPDMARWQSVASSYARFTERHGTTDLLMKLALGRVRECPALYKRKKKWRLAPATTSKTKKREGEHTWRRNYSSLDELSDKVIEVLDDQSKRGQILKLSEAEAKRQYPNLVVASLGANRKDKPSGEVTARVLFDGTHGLSVNTRT